MEKPPAANDFCRNLRDRAGLIADYGRDRYIFRHKSFMEFLAALQLLIECREDQERINIFVDSFNDDWWEEPLRFFISKSDDDKRFNGDDQPVVGVNWYAARAYCFWLSCLETVINRGRRIEDVRRVADIYRLPTEKEWEWAAGGEPDGSIRQYPWSKDKGEPAPNMANYGGNVGATTPVGRYPEGATPQGLMDMAGNVWEWMENPYMTGEIWRALRGGSWSNVQLDLRCFARFSNLPDDRNSNVGFRVVRSILPQS